MFIVLEIYLSNGKSKYVSANFLSYRCKQTSMEITDVFLLQMALIPLSSSLMNLSFLLVLGKKKIKIFQSLPSVEETEFSQKAMGSKNHGSPHHHLLLVEALYLQLAFPSMYLYNTHVILTLLHTVDALVHAISLQKEEARKKTAFILLIITLNLEGTEILCG